MGERQLLNRNVGHFCNRSEDIVYSAGKSCSGARNGAGKLNELAE